MNGSGVRVPASACGPQRSSARERHGNRAVLVQERRADAGRLTVECEVGKATQRFLDPQLQLEAGESRAEAEVPAAAAEALMIVGHAAHIEAVSVLEGRLVAI